MKDARLFRVVTYNVHKCRGLDRRVRPSRIVEVLRETDASVIALQEVLSVKGNGREKEQARFIAEELEMECFFGENRRLKGGAYGNIILSRLPVRASNNYDITWRGREPRGCLRVDVELGGKRLMHVFNVHLGTAFIERRHQGRRLVSEEIINNPELRGGARIVLGDFNEWTRGLATQLLASHLSSADASLHLPRSRSYPGLLPLVHLDHIYHDPTLKLARLTLHKSRTALVASDHLPLIADFQFRAHPSD